jgi:hypothetical protein
MRQFSICLIAALLAAPLVARCEEPAKACPKSGACAKDAQAAGACAKACEKSSLQTVAEWMAAPPCERAACKSAQAAKSCCQQGDQAAACDQKSPCCQSDRNVACQPQDKLTHLNQAVKHLEAAGLLDQAQRVAEHAHQLRRELLAKKLAELSRLQSEVHELNSKAPQPQQVLIKLQVVEVSLTKMRELGLALPDALADGAARCRTDVCPADNTISMQICQQEAIVGLVESLRRENIAKVLAEPNLVAISGRPVSYFCGGEVAVPGKTDKTQEVGTRVDALITMIRDDKVRLEIRPRVTTLATLPSDSGKDAPGPGLRVHQLDTGCEVKFGQTAVIGGMVQDRTHADASRNAVQTLFLVTVEPVTALAPLPIARRPSDTQAE